MGERSGGGAIHPGGGGDLRDPESRSDPLPGDHAHDEQVWQDSAVVIESGRDKKRAAIYTNGTAEELGAERIVQLICRRWGEENAIKELLHKHLINYTPGYVRE